MSADKNLIFFDDKGNSLNFNYNNTTSKYEGKLIFDHNSQGTFKNIGLNLFERVKAFEYIDETHIGLDKLQLFNHSGIFFNSNINKTIQITKIEPTNTDSTFFSKWIYAESIDNLFPINTKFRFDQSIFEFTNIPVWTVVANKRGAILIISNVDNNTFTTIYGGQINLPSSYVGKTISGINTLSFNKYFDESFNPIYPVWSEPLFFTKWNDGDKITVVNTSDNDGVYTIKDKTNLDDIYFTYKLNNDLLGNDLRIEVKLKTDLPLIYTGGVNFNSSGNRIDFLSSITSYFKSGVQFQVINSSLNNIFLTVSQISLFNSLTSYVIGDQVTYNNKIYQCILDYTSTEVNSVIPTDATYWSDPDYLIVEESLSNEFLSSTLTYLTSNIFNFTTAYDTSDSITIASAYEKYKQELSNLGIDLYWSSDTGLLSNLVMPSPYVEVKYFIANTDSTTVVLNYAKVIEVEEELVNEKNLDISELFIKNIILTDLDEFGLKIKINKQEYYIDTDFVYDGLNLDLIQTVSNTIKDFVSRYFFDLIRLGILVEGVYSGVGTSPFVNTVRLTTVYPNVPLSYDVTVGTTANYYINHSSVSFNQIGSVLNIKINGRSYIQLFSTDITSTLDKWNDKYRDILLDFGIVVNTLNNTIYFSLVEDTTKFSYEVLVGKSFKPSINPFTINKYYFGNLGVVVASNKVVTNNIVTKDFETGGFATGMLTNINNSDYPLNNQEYNILHLDPSDMILSYQGPFWGNTNSTPGNGFLSWAFDTGYGYDPSSPYNLTPSIAVTYSITTLGLSGSSDIIYNDSNKSMYISQVLSNMFYQIESDNQIVGLSMSATFSSIKVIDNKINARIYNLHQTGFISLDPNSNTILSDTTLVSSFDIGVNTHTGDVYVTDNASFIRIYDISNTLISTITHTGTQYIVYNYNEKNIVISDSSNQLIEIDGTTKVVTNTVSLSGVTTFLYYNQLNGRVYGFDGTFFSYYGGVVHYLPSISLTSLVNFEISPDLDYLYILTDTNNFYVLDITDSIVSNRTMTYGYMGYSPYDHKLYISSYPNTLIYDTTLNSIYSTISTTGTYSKLEYSWERNSMYMISPYNFPTLEISTNLPFIPFTFSNATYSIISDQYYGSLDPNYTFVDDIWLNTREFIRTPRYNFLDKGENLISYKWVWEEDITPEIFLFDFSGNQLSPTGSYAYTGPKPLDKVYLNIEPNKDTTKNSLAQYQQTVFSEIINELPYIDSEDDISFFPEPLQTFIGFSSDEEGVKSATLLLKKIESVTLDILVNDSNNNIITFTHVDTFASTGNIDDLETGFYGKIDLNIASTDIFTDSNLRVGQLIKVSLVDNQNEYGQYISLNNGKTFKIREIYPRQLIVTYIDKLMESESNVINNFPINLISTAVNVTYLDFNITVLEQELAKIQVYGQTEIEDIRFKIELNNVGHNLMPEDAFIFKNHPIDEQGVDWNILNAKRKEMLLSKGDIFNYIGSYKSIINSINLFGYNDLELYEYYKNIDINSANYGKLIKVEIPDIFDNSVEGWTEKDYLKIHLPNEKFDDTNLFNLTYKITDKEGNFVLGYSVEEASIKLAGLKKWLTKNVIPLTHKILDVTGRADFVQTNYITHQSFDVTILNIHNNITPITGDITECYVLPVNSGSTVYNVVTEFSQNDGNNKPDYFNVQIKTYQNYPEWDVFKTYQVGDYVKYYDLLYVSVLTNNKLNNPRKYLTTSSWSQDTDYIFGQIIEYNRRYYQYAIENPVATYEIDTLSLNNDPEDFVIIGSKIYVLNQGTDKLVIIDSNTYQIINTININNSPIRLIKNDVNGYLYILGIMDMVVMDLTTETIVTTINFSFSTTDDFCINQTSGYIYVPLVNNDLKVISNLNIISTTIVLTNISNNIVWSKNNNRVYAGLADGTSLAIIDSFTDTFLFNVAAGFSSSAGVEMLYNEFNNNVYFIKNFSNTLNRANNNVVNAPYTTNQISHFVINQTNGYVYISDVANNLVVIDSNDVVISSTNIGIHGQLQLDLSSNIIYVSDTLTSKLIVYDLNSMTQLADLNLVDSANMMIFDSLTNSLYGLINSTSNIFKIKLRNDSQPPYLNNDWNDITEWEKVDLKPIQVINEYRDGDNLLPFNFTVDSNVDPFIVLSVVSDNGYGQIYTHKGKYELYISEDASANIRSTDPVENSNP